MSKYDVLKRYLERQEARELAMTFAEIERVLGGPLPASARRQRAWWNNDPQNNPMTRAWLEAGYRAVRVDLAEERLVFARVADAAATMLGIKAGQRRKTGVSAPSVPPLHGFMKGMLRLPPEEELLNPALTRWQSEDSALPEHCPDAC